MYSVVSTSANPVEIEMADTTTVFKAGTKFGVRRSSMHNRKSIGNNFQITIPWSPQMYFSVRGAENFHIYLWIMKDLAWTQSWVVMSWVFGISAISWTTVLLFHAIKDKCFLEIYMLIALILWLSANFVWMTGTLLENLNTALILCVGISMF